MMTVTPSRPNLPRLPVFTETSPLRPARFGHIVLKTAQHDAMSAWYKNFLNAESMFEGPIGSFLTYDDEHHRIFLLNDPGATPREPRSSGLAHFAYLFNSLTDLMHAYERLAADGVVPAYCVNHGFQLSFYYADPDGNEVELGCDCFPSREAINKWFATGVFTADQFGHFVDPATILEMKRNGMSDPDILRETYK
jgi:catechol-2,3-dioxygenase